MWTAFGRLHLSHFARRGGAQLFHGPRVLLAHRHFRVGLGPRGGGGLRGWRRIQDDLETRFTSQSCNVDHLVTFCQRQTSSRPRFLHRPADHFLLNAPGTVKRARDLPFRCTADPRPVLLRGERSSWRASVPGHRRLVAERFPTSPRGCGAYGAKQDQLAAESPHAPRLPAPRPRTACTILPSSRDPAVFCS